ncbi:uncharacterized protein LOC104456951 isoform X2 [Eucalyptus grandis]|uniref:uncharacterized protein LOC104456951 isoform X2 n=1 Tax=Eucalyptus grandis TaxID=71139 RepID=UPI00192EDCD0|nr:uncharacterized protein LOC104456951 isoform X2 [Eucalyptus grandis]
MNACCQGPEGSKIPPMEKSQNALTVGPSLRLQGLLVPFFSFKRPSLGQENQVKVLNKLASARASGAGSGSRVLTDLVEGLEEAAIAVELRLKINQSHPDLKGGSGYLGLEDGSFRGSRFMILFFLLTLRHQLTMTL